MSKRTKGENGPIQNLNVPVEKRDRSTVDQSQPMSLVEQAAAVEFVARTFDVDRVVT